MAAQGQGVWLDLAATTAAQDGGRSICLHAMKMRKVLTATASKEPGDEVVAARRDIPIYCTTTTTATKSIGSGA